MSQTAAVLASALDPYYHQLKFLSDSQRFIAYIALKEKVKAIQIRSEGEQTQASDASGSQTTAAKSTTALAFLLEEDDFEEVRNVEKVDWYLSETPLQWDDNCVQ